MIKFFRKIRQNLLMENKTRKYFKYAIGEIALVMIGILLALQINNWNESRKDTNREIKILSELKNDLEFNLIEIKETITTTSSRIKSSELILDYFKEARPVNDSLKGAFEALKMDGLFNISNTSYKFIESQGINIISNYSLRIKITEMFERHLKNIRTREDRNWKIVNEELIPQMNQKFLASPTIDKSMSYSIEAINTPKNIKTLREDASFKNVIIRLQSWLLVRLNWQPLALKSIEQLIIDVEDEINRLKN